MILLSVNEGTVDGPQANHSSFTVPVQLNLVATRGFDDSSNLQPRYAVR